MYSGTICCDDIDIHGCRFISYYCDLDGNEVKKESND